MITGTHILFYSDDAEADRAFFRDVLGLKTIDSGGGWLISALPSAECGFHPTQGDFPKPTNTGGLHGAQVYLMVSDVNALIADLGAKGVDCSETQEHDWGITTGVTMPSGAILGVYQPKHQTVAGAG